MGGKPSPRIAFCRPLSRPREALSQGLCQGRCRLCELIVKYFYLQHLTLSIFFAKTMCYHMFFCENKPLIWRVRSKRPQDLGERFFEPVEAECNSGNYFWHYEKKLPESLLFTASSTAIPDLHRPTPTGKLFPLLAVARPSDPGGSAAPLSTNVTALSPQVCPGG